MFFKLYIVATFFSIAGLYMWAKWRELKTRDKVRRFNKTLEEYGKKKKGKGQR